MFNLSRTIEERNDEEGRGGNLSKIQAYQN